MKQSCTQEEHNLIVAQVEKDYETGGGKPSAVTPNFATSIQAPASLTAPEKNLSELAKEALKEESDDNEDDDEFENDSEEENDSNDDSKPAAIGNSKSSDNKNQVASVEETNLENSSDDVSTDTKTKKIRAHHDLVLHNLRARIKDPPSNSTSTPDNKEEEPKGDDLPEYFDVEDNSVEQETKRRRGTGGKKIND